MPSGPFGGPRPFSNSGLQLRWVSVGERGQLDSGRQRELRDRVTSQLSRELPEGYMDDIAIEFTEEPKLEVVMIADIDVNNIRPNVETSWKSIELIVDTLSKSVREIADSEDTLMEPDFESPEVRVV